MKKIALAVLLAASLGACATPPTPSNIKQIQQTAVNICRFLPAAQTVADILISSSNAMVSTSLSIAHSICNAVTTNPLADGPGAKNYQPTVNGVRVRGQFVK